MQKITFVKKENKINKFVLAVLCVILCINTSND